jgi:hypothetical protein
MSEKKEEKRSGEIFSFLKKVYCSRSAATTNRKTEEQAGLADTRVANQQDLEEVVAVPREREI